jgi:beta-lactam-binding protein with PASTA domain
LLKIEPIDIFETMKKLLENPFIKKLLIAFGIVVTIILVMDNIVLPLYVSSSEVVVPGVIGMSEDVAFETLKDANFEPVIADTSFGVQVPPGRIFMQKPEEGKIVKKGRKIYLFISGGDQTVSVPLLKGKTVLDARFALERVGLKLGAIEEATSPQPKDMIFDQQFEEGTQVRKGQLIAVSVSIGKSFGNIEIPDLIGKSLTEATKILADSSLSVGKINYQISNSLLPNTILDQYPAPGNKLNSGDKVDLFITKEGVIEQKKEVTE